MTHPIDSVQSTSTSLSLCFLPELNDLAGRQNTVDVRKHSQQNQSDAGADREGRASWGGRQGARVVPVVNYV